MANISAEERQAAERDVAKAFTGSGWEIPDEGELLAYQRDPRSDAVAAQLADLRDAAKGRRQGWIGREFVSKSAVSKFTRELRVALDALERRLLVEGPVQRTNGAWYVQFKAGPVRKPREKKESAPTLTTVS